MFSHPAASQGMTREWGRNSTNTQSSGPSPGRSVLLQVPLHSFSRLEAVLKPRPPVSPRYAPPCPHHDRL